MGKPHKKIHKNIDQITSEYFAYLDWLKLAGKKPGKRVKDDMRHISVKELNDFMKKVNYWNLDVDNEVKIKKIGVFNTLDTETNKITACLLPLDEHNAIVVTGGGSQGDVGPPYHR